MKYLLYSIVLAMNFSLFGLDIAIIPPDVYQLYQGMYEYEPNIPDQYQNFWKHLDKLVRIDGLRLQVHDFSLPMQDIPDETKHLYIFNNIPRWVDKHWELKIAPIQKEKRVLIMWEPPVFMPSMYAKHTYSLFDKIFTFDDSLVDNVKFFKFNYPVLRQMIENIPRFSQKKLLTQISGKKTANGHFSKELYSERLKAIRFFEKHPEFEFEFYGTGWNANKYRNYKGAPTDKIETLKNYKFSLCFENTKNVKGYITEKIFDCFAAGCVPVYLGASNISEYIPKDCYIEFEQDKGYPNLLIELITMNDERYNRYLKAIRRFLNSNKAKKFSHEYVARMIYKALIKKPEPSNEAT